MLIDFNIVYNMFVCVRVKFYYFTEIIFWIFLKSVLIKFKY